MADAHEKFINVCNREISKLVVGQTLSSDAQSTGLGSSVGKLHSDVREDIRQWDQVKLGETVRKQIFEPFLRMNGLKGAAPTPAWGGLSEDQAQVFAVTLNTLKQAGFEPTEEAIPTVSDRMGFPVQRVAPPPPMFPPMLNPAPGQPAKNEGGEEMEGDKADAADDDGKGLKIFSAGNQQLLPTDRVAMARARVLGEAYRGAMAPFRNIILSSGSREECLQKLAAAYVDWQPDRLVSELEAALQMCAAVDDKDRP
jgi:phage gp29-like protein